MPQRPWTRVIKMASGRLPLHEMLKTSNMKRKTSAVWPTKTVNWLTKWANIISVVCTPDKARNKKHWNCFCFFLGYLTLVKNSVIKKTKKNNRNDKIPATKLRSRRPCFRSLMKTAAVRATAIKYTILYGKTKGNRIVLMLFRSYWNVPTWG